MANRHHASTEAQGFAPLPLATHGISAQFSTTLFDTPADAYILSVQPDINTALVRTRATGALFHPYGLEQWPRDDVAWLRGPGKK